MLENRRVVFLQPYVPAYREPLFVHLRRGLSDLGAEVVVAVDRSTVERHDQTHAQVDRVLGSRLRGKVRMRPLGSLDLTGEDLVIAEQALKNLEVYPLAAAPRYRRPGLAFWGHGRFSQQSATLDRLKQALTKKSDWFFAYTPSGGRWVTDHGFPETRVTVLNNTIDALGLAQDLERVSDDALETFLRKYRLSEGRTALFLGGVDDEKDIDFVLAVASAAAYADPSFCLMIGGTGRGLPKVRAAISEGSPVRYLGRVDGLGKALALRSASALIMPSCVGLVAVDAIVADLPVVTRSARGQMPEYEYLDHRLAVHAGELASPEQFAQEVLTTMGHASVTGSQGPLHFRDRAQPWSVELMAQRFIDGIEQWAEIRRFRL